MGPLVADQQGEPHGVVLGEAGRHVDLRTGAVAVEQNQRPPGMVPGDKPAGQAQAVEALHGDSLRVPVPEPADSPVERVAVVPPPGGVQRLRRVIGRDGPPDKRKDEHARAQQRQGQQKHNHGYNEGHGAASGHSTDLRLSAI